MRSSLKTLLVSAASASLACGAGPSSTPVVNPGADTPGPATAGTSGATLDSVGLDALAMDAKANPCTDFYRFACGGWLDATEIPADESSWTRSFHEIRKRNELELKRLLEEAASQAPADPSGRALGTYYAACMDESTVNGLGAQPIAPLLEKAARVKDAPSVMRLTAELHAAGIWPLFDIAPVQDPNDATRWIAGLDQGGLGLPDRDHYLRDDEPTQKLRSFYAGHVERMLALAGFPTADAKKAAADVVRLETELAKVSKTRVERRDPKGMFNRLTVAKLRELAPAVDWSAYLKTLSVPASGELNVTAPLFLEGLQSVLKRESTAAWRAYLAWHIVRSTARTLSQPFVDEAFALEQVLTGQAEQKARWRRCVASTDAALPDLLGQSYVATSFAGESKTAAEGMVHAISGAFARELDRLTWMDAPTRARAHQKLDAMAYLIGYPSKWKTYDFEVDPKTYASNAARARAFNLARELAKIGNAVDREEWQMSPPTVNAYYDPQRNHMVFPAGILQPPFYDVKSAAAVNLGAVGMVVGHELTHGFDDEGSQYDAQGNLKNWWEPSVNERFKEKTACVANQYSGYEALPGLKLNGQLTLGENIADLGGVKLAYAAFRATRDAAGEAAAPVTAGGYSEDQQFFLAMGQAWCAKYRPELERLMAQTNPHSPPRFRVQGALANLPEFSAAFACAARPEDQVCTIW
jgi:putative endopeptidase